MSSLYELTDMYETLMNMLYDEEEDEQCIMDTLEGLEGDIEEKADNYAKIIKSLEANVDAIKKEEERLYRRRVSLDNWSKRMKSILEANMKAIGKTKFKTELFSFNIQKNGGLQPLKLDVQVKELPKEFQIPQDPLPNNDRIRDLLKKQSVAWAHLEPRGESLRIR